MKPRYYEPKNNQTLEETLQNLFAVNIECVRLEIAIGSEKKGLIARIQMTAHQRNAEEMLEGVNAPASADLFNANKSEKIATMLITPENIKSPDIRMKLILLGAMVPQ